MAQWGQGYQYPMQTGFNPQQLAPQPTGFPGQRPPGFQQPQQTGFPGQQGFQQPQQTGFPGAQGFQQPQQTGFQQPLQTGFQQPQQTGFPGQQLQPQATGFPGSTFQQRAPPPPVPPIPSQFQQQQQPQQNVQGGFLGAQQPANRFLTSSPGLSPLTAQPTGFQGGGGLRPLVPQATGFVDPRLQMMSNTFLPANTSAPYNAAGLPQFQQQQSGFSLQQSFQQHNQTQRGNTAPRIPWNLSKAEKKSYDQIFRAWDSGNTGFISGQTALEVFGQSGLDRNDLAKIWALADVENRGKLNLAEFHVAMGLIYRRLNGNDIPDVLPPELIPPSRRDLEESVDVLKDILKNDTRARSPAGLDSGPASRMRERSFYNSTAAGAGGRQDATVYKYKDETPAGGFYQPRSRHVDRSAIRTTSESASPAADLDDMKRQLENTAKMLDRVADENAAKTAEDDALEREMEDLKYRVKRVNEDLDYVSRGPRSVAKDEERRKLERELMELMHEKLPDLERRIKDREERKEREKREWARERDRRNDRFGRYDDRDDRYSSSRYDRDRDRDPYDRPRSAYDRDDRPRSAYDRDDRPRDWDRERDRDYERDRPYSRNRDRERDYDRPRSPPAARSPPPPPPSAPPSTANRAPPPAPTPSTTAAAKKALTAEERSALARQRIQERMAALGVVAPSPSPKIDTSVEDRLAQEKKEAEEKAKAAEREAEERERIRRERLEGEKALKEGKSPTSPGPSTPASSVPPATSQVPTPKATPPPPPAPKAKPPAPAPPKPRKAPAPRPPAPRAPHAAPAPPAPPVAPTPPAAPAPPSAPTVDPEEEAMRAREEELRRKREERLARLRQLEQEEEEARLAEEQRARQRAEQRAAASAPPPAPPAPAAPEPFHPAASASAPAPPPPPPPPAPPAPSSHTSTPSVDKSATNPFSRLMKESPGSAPAAPSTPGGSSSTNPFFKNQVVSPPAAPPAPPAPPAPSFDPTPAAPPSAPKSPAPPTVRTSYHTAPGDSEDDWEDVQEKEDDDSSDDELDSSRDTRSKLAQQLFGSILPPSRPQSAAASAPTKAAASPEPSSPAPPPPPPPPLSAPPMASNIPAGIPAPPPPPTPGAPPAPPAPAAPAIAAPAPSGDRSALLGAIQAGAKLRKAKTNDRSGAALSGRVIGDDAPPPHISAAPRMPSPPAPAPAPEHHAPPPGPQVEHAPEETQPTPPPMTSVRSSNRESVDWYAGLAAEGSAVQRGPSEPLPAMVEEEEEPPTTVPQIQVDHSDDAGALADVDMNTEYRVRSLYAYQAQRPEELTFGENLILTAHPSKSGSDWWYGTVVRDGKSGFFPKTYVEQVTSVVAHALYDYNGSNADELPFSEGDQLTIVDRTDADWWKAEQGGVVFIVPAAYLSLADAAVLPVDPSLRPADSHVEIEALAKTPSPIQSQAVTAANQDSGPHEPKSDSSDDEDTDSEYVTATDTDTDQSEAEVKNEEARRRDRQARAAERQRVLQAAGLIIKTESQPPPRPARSRSHRRRRPAPAVPDRSPQIPASPMKELPALPESESANSALRLDDAFERYEAYRQNHVALNRLSVASVESGTSTTSPRSSTFSLSLTPTPTPTASASEGESRAHSFLHFFGHGRKTPVNDGEPRTMPVISAPILQREPSPAPGEQDAAFGTSWASLVDKSALEGIPTGERRRQEAIFELIVTEAAYVRDLQLIVEHFYANVYALLDEKARTVIFANVEDILLMNTTFLSSLEERQKECRLYIDKIGDILNTNMANLSVYMDYCVNQGSAIKVLQSLRQSNPELSACLQRLRDDPTARNLDLSSYLLVPMQRITRYPLLFKQIIHYTDTGDDRSQIENARDMAEKVLAHINETIREQEGRERLKEVSKDLWIGQGRLDLTAPTRYMGPRKLLKEGVLMKAKSGRKLRAFLCSDILVLTEEATKSLYRMPLSLSEVEVRESSGARDDTAFQLAVSYPRGGDAVSLRATSARECQLWMQAIHSAAKRSRDAQRRAARKSRG
ncbi:hypothetical protein BD413DRAFT_505992 [Trametes elegans]|nr:hypothetical protein BD413DRAFT_505992 [Trametes elegans]